MSRAAWAPEAEAETLSPQRAEACRAVARAIGYPHRCPICDAELGAGSVAGFRTHDMLRQHALAVHGEAL
jgi:hypothetical protein